MNKVETYVNKLIEVQGIDKALQIVTSMNNIASHPSGINLTNEVDWIINTNGSIATFNPPKNEGHRTKGNKAKRERAAQNFYKAALQLLTKRHKVINS